MKNSTVRQEGTISKYVRFYRKHRERRRAESRQFSVDRREEVLKEYGKRCVCCGEKEPKFLAIDHIFSGGNKHRKDIGQGGLYGWLKKNGFPKDSFQILCHNCNSAKGYYGK